jgi:hypothetical protein
MLSLIRLWEAFSQATFRRPPSQKSSDLTPDRDHTAAPVERAIGERVFSAF